MKDPKRSRQFVSGRKWGKVALDFCRKSAFIPTGPASEIGWSLQSNNSGCKFSGFTARGSNGICFRNIEKAHQAVLKLRNQDAVTVEENNCQWYQWTATFFSDRAKLRTYSRNWYGLQKHTCLLLAAKGHLFGSILLNWVHALLPLRLPGTLTWISFWQPKQMLNIPCELFRVFTNASPWAPWDSFIETPVVCVPTEF